MLQAAGSDAGAILNLYPNNEGVICRVRTLNAGTFSIHIENEGVDYYQLSADLKAGSDFSKLFSDRLLAPGVNVFSLYADNRLVAKRLFYMSATRSVAINELKLSRQLDLQAMFNRKITGNYSILVNALQMADLKITMPQISLPSKQQTILTCSYCRAPASFLLMYRQTVSASY